MGKTGGTFGAAFQHVKNHGPCVILLENVRGLKGKNLKRCLQMPRLAGYIVIVVTNCCSNHALAARRRRVWIVGVLSSHQLDTRSTVALQNKANWLEQDLRQLGPRLEECLLEMDIGSAMVRQTLEKKAATQKDRKSLAKWPDVHKKYWHKLGYLRPPREHPVLKRFQEQWPLTPREKQCLSYVRIKRSPGPGDVVCVDLSQSIHQLPMALNLSTCIIPNSKIVALFNSNFQNVEQSEKLKSRPLLGVELLRLRAMSLGNLPNVSALNNFQARR